jgi:hypothetical protein
MLQTRNLNPKPRNTSGIARPEKLKGRKKNESKFVVQREFF